MQYLKVYFNSRAKYLTLQSELVLLFQMIKYNVYLMHNLQKISGPCWQIIILAYVNSVYNPADSRRGNRDDSQGMICFYSEPLLKNKTTTNFYV